jgi:hypothetical protein
MPKGILGRPTVPRPPGRPRILDDPAKAVMGAPRIRPITTRDYGKGGTIYSGAPDMGVRGAGIGYGGGFSGLGGLKP